MLEWYALYVQYCVCSYLLQARLHLWLSEVAAPTRRRCNTCLAQSTPASQSSYNACHVLLAFLGCVRGAPTSSLQGDSC